VDGDDNNDIGFTPPVLSLFIILETSRFGPTAAAVAVDEEAEEFAQVLGRIEARALLISEHDGPDAGADAAGAAVGGNGGALGGRVEIDCEAMRDDDAPEEEEEAAGGPTITAAGGADAADATTALFMLLLRVAELVITACKPKLG
jgi:hypothetical protein